MKIIPSHNLTSNQTKPNQIDPTNSHQIKRQLVEGLGLSGLPFKRVHLWPKSFEGCVGGGVGGELPAHSVAYFVGLEIDPRRSKKGAVLDVDKVRYISNLTERL